MEVRGPADKLRDLARVSARTGASGTPTTEGSLTTESLHAVRMTAPFASTLRAESRRLNTKVVEALMIKRSPFFGAALLRTD